MSVPHSVQQQMQRYRRRKSLHRRKPSIDTPLLPHTRPATPPPEPLLSLPHHPSLLAFFRSLPPLTTSTPQPLHFLFGYGSLISAPSRRRTLARDTPALPVRVHHLHRSWSYHCPRRSYTAVGVARVPGARCNGVLVPVPDPAQDLPALDAREAAYDRVQVAWEDVELLLDDAATATPAAAAVPSDAVLWVYRLRDAAPRTPTPDDEPEPTSSTTSAAVHRPSPVSPIPQSYVDCIVTGCLAISEAFALEFVQTTEGWDAGTWIDDRGAAGPVRRYVPCVGAGEKGVCEEGARTVDEVVERVVGRRVLEGRVVVGSP
ncbi:hypothetical protein HDU96_000461 [Phlyctochytrium bullatum]|nr:hypothetical protein HDU96_000461 [Phlyctochytrium bullatum]